MNVRKIQVRDTYVSLPELLVFFSDLNDCCPDFIQSFKF